MRAAGFLGGAVLGLAVALLLVGAGSLYPGQGHTTAGSAQVAPRATVNSGSSTTSSTAGALLAGIASPSAPVSKASTSASFGAISSPSPSVAAARPDSTISLIPKESVGTLAGTLAPLLVGLVLAVMVYGVYARRQDAST